MRAGITPIIGFVMLLMIVLSLGLGAQQFLTQQQDRIVQGSQPVSLETVNVSCQPGAITWWINNTGETPVPRGTGTFTVAENGSINGTLSTDQIGLSGGFLDAGGIGDYTRTPPQPLFPGRRYTLELAFGDTTIGSSCRAGIPWNQSMIDWDYRRAIWSDQSGSQATFINLDYSALTSSGKLRPDCGDIRVLDGNAITAYQVNECSVANGVEVEFSFNNDPSAVETYIYYGNLQAGAGSESNVAGCTPGNGNPLPPDSNAGMNPCSGGPGGPGDATFILGAEETSGLY